MTIDLRPVPTPTCLHHRYPSERAAQPCHVWLDCQRGALGAAYEPNIGNAVSPDVHFGHTLQWAIPALLADAANELLESLRSLAERVVAGHSNRWNGQNFVAAFDDDATAAIDAIHDACERSFDDARLVVYCDAADWYGGLGNYAAQRRELGIDAAMTDAQLEALAEGEAKAALDNGVHVVDGLARHLQRLRDAAPRAEPAREVVDE